MDCLAPRNIRSKLAGSLWKKNSRKGRKNAKQAPSAPRFMDKSNQYFRAAALARKTVERLQHDGHSADESKRMVVALINAEEFAVMTGRHSFDEARFAELLDQLPLN